MKKLESLEKSILGDTNQISSERYFVTVTTLVASFILLILSFVHFFMELSIIPVILSGSSSILMLVLYYFVRFQNYLLIPKIILTVGGLILLDFTWYSKFLSNGPVLFFILIFAALVIWVWSGKQLSLLMAFYFINLAVLFYVDNNAPEYLFRYPETKSRSIDIFLSFFFYSILLISLLYFIKREFVKQNCKLSEVNNLYFGLVSNTTIGLYQSTPSGQVLSANPALIKMLNFNSLEDLLQRDLSKGSYLEINKRTEFKKIIAEKGEITDFESEWFTKNSDVIVVLESAKAVKNDNGKIIRYDGTVQDITEKKKIQRELIEALGKAEESDRLKSAFLANMSHEIRTPLNGILGFADLLKESKPSIQKQKEYIGIIEKSGVRMLNIINDIIDISKIEAGLMKLNIKESNINQQIEYVYTFFKPEIERKGMTISFKSPLPEKESIIKTDREKVFSILTNLIKNALKYSKEGEIKIGYILKSDYIEFYVKDTGIGIPKDRQKAIFERFIQADIEDRMALQGAGLGLSISKAYTEMLGGKIWVESEEGIGSTFYFTLPYQICSEEILTVKDLVSTKKEKNNIQNLKILIVEDDEPSEMLISMIVKEFCTEVLKAKTGKEAIEICRNNSDINLILMDIQMPEMNGYDSTRQIRQFNKDVIIIAQTAFGLSGDREKSIEAGCNEYIMKPIIKDKLLVLIQKYFNNKRK
jgi:PAS domain S-box-containing protein